MISCLEILSLKESYKSGFKVYGNAVRVFDFSILFVIEKAFSCLSLQSAAGGLKFLE
jgi:hypothetical protein